MKHRRLLPQLIIFITICTLISGCAQYFRPELTPIQQAKLNVKIFTDQIKAINDALNEQLQIEKEQISQGTDPDWLLKKLRIEHKLDQKLKRANMILKEYTREVKMWEQTGLMSPNIIPYEHEFRAMMVEIINLLKEMAIENAKKKSERGR